MDIASGSTLGSPTLSAPRLRPLALAKADGDGGEAAGGARGTALPQDSLSLSPEGLASAAGRSASGEAARSGPTAGNAASVRPGPDAGASAPRPDPSAGIPAAVQPDPAAALPPAALPNAGAPQATRPGAAPGTGPVAPPSGMKSFAYGILGVDRPKGQKPAQEEDYSAGQWVGAALKIAGVVALIA